MFNTEFENSSVTRTFNIKGLEKYMIPNNFTFIRQIRYSKAFYN